MKKNEALYKKTVLTILNTSLLCFFITIIIAILVFLPMLKKSAVSEAKTINTAVLESLDNVMNDSGKFIRNISLPLGINDSVQTYFSSPTKANEIQARITLNYLTGNEKDIRSAILICDDMTLIGSEDALVPADYAMLKKSWYIDLSENQMGRAVSPTYTISEKKETIHSIVFARRFLNQNTWYTLILFINLNEALDAIDTLVGDTLDAYCLMDSTDNTFYEYGDLAWSTLRFEIPFIDKDSETAYQNGILLSNASSDHQFRINSYISPKRLFRSLFPFLAALTIALFFLTLLILITLSRRMNSITKPIISLAGHMSQFSPEEMMTPVVHDRSDEIGELQAAYNRMILELENNIKALSQKEKEEQQARFSLLVSQIDPHFIYNTINSINYLARKNRSEDIITVNTALIAILRDRLRVSSIEFTDTIAREKEVVEKYLLIEKFMYGGSLTVYWQIDDALLNMAIPKNMIQPLVENSLFHGLIDEESGELNGTITIAFEKTDQGLILRVQDDGDGIDKVTLDKLRQNTYDPETRGKGIGLTNIRGRLYYLYGRDNGLMIDSSPGKGSTITIEFF